MVFIWVLDFYQRVFHSNPQRIYPAEVIHRIPVLWMRFTAVFDKLIHFLKMNQDSSFDFIFAAFNNTRFLGNSSTFGCTIRDWRNPEQQKLYHWEMNKQSDAYSTNAYGIGKDPNHHCYFFEYKEFKPVFLFCPWTIKNPMEQLDVTITRIDFILHRQFRLRLPVHPTGEPLFSEFITLKWFHEQFASAIATNQHYPDFPELGFPKLDWTVINSLLTDPLVNQYT